MNAGGWSPDGTRIKQVAHRVLPCALNRSDANVPIGRNSPRDTDGRNLDTDARHHFDSKTPWGNISNGKSMLLLGKPNASCTIEIPASLRSDGVRVHPGIPFGFLSELAFSFTGIPSQP